MKKGYIVVLDAIIALMFILIIFTAVFSVHYSKTSKTGSTSFKNLHYLTEDLLDVMNKQGVLDEVGALWAEANGSTNSTAWINASNISGKYLEILVPKNVGYRMTIEDKTIVENLSRIPENSAISKTHSSRFLVGYSKGLPTLGHVARAFLTKIREKTTSSYVYFGGFEGQGNITKTLSLPDSLDTILGAYIEVFAGSDFNLFVNGNPCGSFTPTVWNMTANIKKNITCLSNFQVNNTLYIKFISTNISKQYIGGGFVSVTYNTSEMDTAESSGTTMSYLPGIDGLINLYSSFYVPNTPNSMEIHLKFLNNYTTYLNIGDKRVFNSSGRNTTQTVTLTDANLTMLNYGAIGGKTIPIRLGIENITGEALTGNVDVILITDVSGSMQWTLINDTTGTVRNCNDPNLYNSSTSRVSLAKCLDTEFVNIILNNNSNNRVGLVSFNTEAEANGGTSYPLSNDNNSLINKINTYNAGGGTCLCCAINKAMELLSNISQGNSVTLAVPVESPHPYPNNLNPPGSGVWTINGPANATSMRVHFTSIRTEKYHDYLWVTDSNGSHVTLPGWESNGRPNEIDTDYTISNYWSGWGNGSTIKINLYTDNSVRRYGFKIDKYEYATAVNISSRQRYIIAMTDGITGYHCGGCNYNGGCSYTGTCTATIGTKDGTCNGDAVDCNGAQCDTAIGDAISSSIRARTYFGATVYSVGFGPVSTGCPNANRTLMSIANCGNGSYYGSSNASELTDIYKNIAQEIVAAAYKSQTVTVIGNVLRSILYPESYIKATYIPSPLNISVFGKITLTQNTDRFNDTQNCSGKIFVTASARVTDALVTSYSEEYWTDKLYLEGSPVYQLTDYGNDYNSLGDPFIVQIPNPIYNLLPSKNNSITIRTGNSPTEDMGCSPDDRAIYTIRLDSRVGYANVFPEKNGCNWVIQFEDNTNMSVKIPSGYNGTKQCSYTSSNLTYGTTDAIDDAIYRLLKKLDSNGNNKIDVKFDSDMIEFDFSRAGGVRSLWGPIIIKLILWT